MSELDTPVEKQSSEIAPVREANRIVALDVLRGFAILGIFVVNIGFFAGPVMDVMMIPPDATDGDRWVRGIVTALFEFKFMAIFSLLFGVGLIIQLQRSEQKSTRFVPYYLRRNFLLMALGLIHALLFWYGDILFMYSVAAMLVMWLARLKANILLLLSGVMLFVSVFLVAAMTFLGALSPQPPDEPDAPVTTEAVIEDASDVGADIAEAVDSTPPAVVDDRFERFTESFQNMQGQRGLNVPERIAYGEGPYLATFIMRAVSFGIIVALSVIGGFGARILVMFLLGMALMKLDFFDASRKRWHLIFAGVGLLIGLPFELLVGYHSGTAESVNTLSFAAWQTVHQVSSFLLCLGYVGAVTLLVHAGVLKWLQLGFAAIGRTALTNYLLQTVVATTIFYWYGFGYFDTFTRSQQMALVATIYPLQMVISALWLQKFKFGPMEWLWRTLTYGKRQPMLRA